MSAVGRTLTGAWIETDVGENAMAAVKSRTLTGAWIETRQRKVQAQMRTVAPSRVRGLKRSIEKGKFEVVKSHPHGCVD